MEDRAHERLRVWTADDTWDQLLDHVVVKDDSVGDVTLVLVGASCRALPSATTLVVPDDALTWLSPLLSPSATSAGDAAVAVQRL